MEKKQKKLWLVTHTHRFGHSTYLVRAHRCPSLKRLIKVLEIDFEPDREDEALEVELMGEPVEM